MEEQDAEITFLGDDEFVALYPEDAAMAAALGASVRIACSNCAGECCRIVNCFFYSSQFHSCPIHPYRPLACRQWCCSRITNGQTGLSPAEVANLHEIASPGPDWLPNSVREEVVEIMKLLARSQMAPEAAEAALLRAVGLYYSGLKAQP